MDSMDLENQDLGLSSVPEHYAHLCKVLVIRYFEVICLLFPLLFDLASQKHRWHYDSRNTFEPCSLQTHLIVTFAITLHAISQNQCNINDLE
jgi:hypothetical protein